MTLDNSFCISALQRALSLGTPEIFNSDQGSQFTSRAFTGILQGAGIRISMDGRRRAYDNIFVERLWRTVKYEEVCRVPGSDTPGVRRTARLPLQSPYGLPPWQPHHPD